MVCAHGGTNGQPWQGACADCRIDGIHCAIIGLFDRVVCQHNKMQSACSGCAIDGRSCLVLGPTQEVTCHHFAGEGYCGNCQVTGMPLCWTTQRARMKVEVLWDLALTKLSAPYTATIDQTIVEGPGPRRFEFMRSFVRHRSITSPTGKPPVTSARPVTRAMG